MKNSLFRVIGISLILMALIFVSIPSISTFASGSVSDNFSIDGNKLLKYTGTGTSVSVPNGIEIIASEAFVSSSISSVTFPKSLTTIENGAFRDCQNLNRIILNEGFKTIENGAFADCESLFSVTIPNTIEFIGNGVFAGCKDLAELDIDDNYYYTYDDGVLYNKDKTILLEVLSGRSKKVYSMPNTVEKVQKYAFWGCNKLEEVKLSIELIEAGDFAFSNLRNVKEIIIPYSCKAIQIKSFENCSNLEKIVIPMSVNKIDVTAFDGCYKLNIVAEDGTVAKAFADEFETNLAQKIENDASLSQNGLYEEDMDLEVNINESPTESSSNKYYASNVENYVEWDKNSKDVIAKTKIVDNNAILFIEQKENIYEINSVDHQGQTISCNYIYKDKLKSKAFYSQDIESIVIPNNIYQIGDFAFARSNLNNVIIPESITKIGYGAFYHCDNLETISIPTSVTEIEPYAFEYTPYLTNWKNDSNIIDSDFLIVGDGILISYKGNEETVVIPSTVKQIGASVFENNETIKKVIIPDSVFNIGEASFQNCQKLTIVEGGNSVKQIKDRAFYRCPISNIIINPSVLEIGLGAFGGNEQCKCVTFLGTNIPKISLEKSAKRLNNSDLRILCFEGIDIAYISNSKISLDNTLLSNYDYGFAGTIYCDNEILEVSAMSQDELLSNVIDFKFNNTDEIENNYVFDLQKIEDSPELIEKLKSVYPELNESTFQFYNISLLDKSQTIQIEKLGSSTVELKLNADYLNIDFNKDYCFVTINDDGELEILPAKLIKDSSEYIAFTTNHFSQYALIIPDGELKDLIVKKSGNHSINIDSNLDDSPNTGDSNSLLIILSIGLFCSGFAFLLVSKYKYRIQY